jgi:hypothetical protein
MKQRWHGDCDMNSMKQLLLLSLTALLITEAPAASIVTVAENPQATVSSLQNTSAFTFDNLSLGMNKNVAWSGVGTFDQLYILKADQYGGAADAANPKGSPYSVQGVGSPVKTTTLKLNAASSYFGFWWSAGDASNELSFYRGDTLVSQFTTSSLLGNMPKTYYGNPLTGQNKGEPYAFINFFGDGLTSWDKIVLTNVTSSGFESDNYTNRVNAWSPSADGALPGTPVAVVVGKTVTPTKKLPTTWVAGPAAPMPPGYAVLAFVALLGLKQMRRQEA